MNFVVEATIGAGKTTLIKNMIKVLLKDHDIDAQAVLEPVNEWVSTHLEIFCLCSELTSPCTASPPKCSLCPP